MRIPRRALFLVIPLALSAVAPRAANAKKVKPAAADTVTVKAGGLDLQLPKTWTQSPPTSSMRIAEFKLPRAKGDTEDAEFVVFYFGVGGGGGVQPNVDRWVAQFDAKDRTVALVQGEGKQGSYVLATISGTYNLSVGPPMGGKSRPVANAQVLGMIIKNDTGPYFLKLWGQRHTVESTAKVLRAAIGAKGKEMPYKP